MNKLINDYQQSVIPKTLHFVWVGGGRKSDKMNHCMDSWRRICPEYQIKEWNESNFDIDKSPLIKKGLEQKNWALAADAMRTFILYENGGVYVDTDIEFLRPIDQFLMHEFFIGYESKFWANTAIIGAIKFHPLLDQLTKLYSSDFGLKMSNLMTVHIFSALLKRFYRIKPNGKTFIHENSVAVYSKDWFYPQSYLTHKLRMTKNTHAVHYYSATWGTEKQIKALKTMRKFNFLYIPPLIRPIERIVASVYRKKVNRVIKQSLIIKTDI